MSRDVFTAAMARVVAIAHAVMMLAEGGVFSQASAPTFSTVRQAHVTRVCLSILFCILFLAAGLSFHSAFPADHSWSEMLLNYQGGFLKRSLLGEIAYQINPFVPAQTLVTVIVIALYCGVAIWTVRFCTERLSVAALLFLVSPAGLLFAIHDPRAFGRKDIVILAALALSALIIEQVRRTGVAFGLILALYFVVGLAIEVAWFYLPATLVLLGLTHRPPRSTWLRAAGILLIYAIAIYPLATAYPGHDPRPGIIAAWQTIHPSVYENALCCIGVNFSQAASMSSATLQSAGLGYALSFVLSLVPIAFLRPSWKPDWPAVLGLAAAFVCMLAPIALAADWGRYIYLLSFHSFAVMALTSEGYRPKTPQVWAALVPLAVLYGFAWTMPHFFVGILPGVLLS